MVRYEVFTFGLPSMIKELKREILLLCQHKLEMYAHTLGNRRYIGLRGECEFMTWQLGDANRALFLEGESLGS